MKRNKTRICICCGKEYKYCPSCDGDSTLPRWMSNFDTDACHVAFQAATDYNYKEIDEAEARKRLESVDLSDKESFIEPVKEFINKILANKEPEADTHKRVSHLRTKSDLFDD